jgi:hypothetical protein
MARSPDYLRDRGLADRAEPPPQVVPFVIGADGLPTQPVEGVVVLAGSLPEDYAARVAVLELLAKNTDLVEEYTMVLTAARAYLAFLTATEPAPRKQETHTDE